MLVDRRGTMTTDLLTIAEAQIAEKQFKEIQAIKELLEADKETLKKAIELVNSHTLYKKVCDEYVRGRYRYVLATEEMLKEDYLKEAKYRKGIRFIKGEWSKTYNTGVLEVNGETYYDIRYALQNYERMVKDEEDSLRRLNKSICEIKEDLKNMKKNYPSLKQAITDWMEYQRQESEKEA